MQPSAPAEPPPPAAVAPPVVPTVTPQLAAEERWLQGLFAGTPVRIGPGPGGALRLEVPLRFAFDTGQAAVKPPLAAVLDKLAASLARLPGARLQIATPLAAQGDGLRDALKARGVAVYRLGRLPARADAVELRMLAPIAVIERLEDAPDAGVGRR